MPIPINLDTINRLYGTSYTSFELQQFFDSVAEPRDAIRTSEDVIVSKVGRELYEKFFRNYTRKQWGLDPSELDATVIARIPVRTNRDDRYFTDTYQAMPAARLHPDVRAHARPSEHQDPAEHRLPGDRGIDRRTTVWCSPARSTSTSTSVLASCRTGRSSSSSKRSNTPRHQPVAVVNYPNDNAFTRITEIKHVTGQEHREDDAGDRVSAAEGDPYYPVPRPENAALYRSYQELADATEGVHFVGRLATYKYYNMDQVVAQALATYSRIVGLPRRELLGA